MVDDIHDDGDLSGESTRFEEGDSQQMLGKSFRHHMFSLGVGNIKLGRMPLTSSQPSIVSTKLNLMYMS